MVKADKKVPKAGEKTAVEKKPKAVKVKKAAEKPAQEVTKTIKKTKIKKRPFSRYVTSVFITCFTNACSNSRSVTLACSCGSNFMLY